ncbi:MULTISPECIES: hypothetical protein [Metallosphaera]|uniref:hypothetical protein n=1 Tax=Metallosphaera TaxID=41980 RepID=UPI001F06821D|nr:hypothetical protein [Metallosphaera sedula]MCH1770419.1 hypothetical protein [Metallosphaera sedula]MCP6727747.1 hypothetical protein [Metallosphaera sedula]
MKILRELEFRREEICGANNPVRIIINTVRELGDCEGIKVKVNDYDWVLTLRNLAEIHDFEVEEGEKENNFLNLIIYKRC